MNDILAAILIFVCGFTLGIIASAKTEETNWRKDCEKVGFHRSGDKVYECRERK